MAKKDKTTPATASAVTGNKWMLAGIGIIIVILAIIAILMATSSGSTGGSVAAVPMAECGRTVIDYANANLVQANTTATLGGVTEKNGVYNIAVTYQGREITLYATKDCSFLFSGITDLKAAPATETTPVPTTVAAPVKSASPTVELFVMSFCPYGVQAETAMKPVVDLLGSKADFNVRYIATVQGTTADSVKSLHGLAEAKEDLRQLCVAKYYPQQLWTYIEGINAQCYPTWQNATQLAACQQNVTATLSMDNQKIETCAASSEGLDLLRADGVITAKESVSGSPTLIINGQRYNGQRTAEAYKQFICDRFTTAPAECATNLSSTAAASSGSC
jgi:glutaredoxin